MTSPIYIVICGTLEPYCAERELKDMGRAETIRDIARGEWSNISSVIEVGTDRDVTEEFLHCAKWGDHMVSRGDRIANTQDHVRKLQRESV